MLKLIIGVKGTGKTKTLIDMVNKAADQTNGSVVCIEKGSKLKFDVKHQVRLIDVKEYEVSGADALYGMVCGLFAANYDITHIFIDSALKICNEDIDAFHQLLGLVKKFSDKNKVEVVITASANPDDLPDKVKEFIS